MVLSEETGIEAKTVASVLVRYFDHGELSIADDARYCSLMRRACFRRRTLLCLRRIAEERGAILRVIGDPAQHSSVNAGGIFRYIAEHYPDETPALTHLYPQQGTDMEEVRLVNAEYREGKITKALERVAKDERIIEATFGEEAYDLLTCAWYGE